MTHMEAIEKMRTEWIGRKVIFKGQYYTVVDVDSNYSLLIDKPARFTATTAVATSMVKPVTQLDFEISAFVASVLLSGAEREPITAEMAFNCILNWVRDGVDIPHGITAQKLADEWNKQVSLWAGGKDDCYV